MKDEGAGAEFLQGHFKNMIHAKTNISFKSRNKSCLSLLGIKLIRSVCIYPRANQSSEVYFEEKH